ncbi:MAG: flagellar biosynthesis anti-sigma factor FlgM [Treponemataceae bacterium]|nr:flagellar biosynthesis anti-sigma factor FlgM [Treponemataceae bacterium]
MMTNKIGGINPLNNVQNARRTNEPKKSTFGVDSVSVSKEAKEMAEAYYMNQVAAETPNVRADRVAEIKAKIQDPSYLNSAAIASAADRIMESFGL